MIKRVQSASLEIGMYNLSTSSGTVELIIEWTLTIRVIIK